MSQTQTINTPQDYVNYTFNIEARGIAEVSSELMGLSNTVGNILGQLAFKTSEFLSHTDMLAIGTGAAISAMFVSASKDAIHFQQQIANVQAIGGETINAQAIGAAAMEFSNKFGMATSSMTEGLEALARAGITSTNVMKEVLAEGVKLSKLEGLDLEDSINDLIATTNLLSEAGVDMNDANYGQLVQDMNQHIVSTSESAPINAQNIIQTLQHVGGYASASGMDQEDLFAVIAQLGSRGTKGEMAGTALRAFIAAGQKDTAQRALARIGLNVSDLWNNNGETMLPISEMKDVLDNALEARGYSKQEKLEFYSDFAGYKQANQIMKIDTSEVQKYKEDIANAWDLGKKLDVILGTVRGNLDRIWQITQNFMTKVGTNLLNVMNAILTPVRIFLELMTKIPFADKAVAAGMIFVAFRTGLIIFNKLVPAIGGFISGIGKAKDETRGFRGEWQKTREEIEKAKDIIFLLREGDQEGLAQKHYEEHGLSARNKMDTEHKIAGQMYMASDWYKQHGRIAYDDLDVAVQDMILERFKATKAFKENYETYVEKTKANVEEIVANPIIIDTFEEKDTLEAISVWVQEIFDLLNSDRTRGKTDHSADNEQGSQDNRRRNAQARTLSNIFEDRVRGNSYGNVNFKYERSAEGYAEAKAGLKQAYKDLREYTQALSNTDSNNINAKQRSAYKKLFTTTVSERGQQASKMANESEIRLIFEKGVLESHERPHEGIKDSQVRYIADKLGLDEFKFHDYKQDDKRAEFAQAVHEAIQNIAEDRRQAVIDEIINGTGNDIHTKGTNKLWEESLDQIAIGRKEFLLSKPQIANSIVSQLSHINTAGYNSNTEAVLDYFKGLDDNHQDWNIAIKTAMEVLKGDSDYSKVEKNTIKYIADNIARHKETILSYQADAEVLGFSQGLKDEIEAVINDMRNDEATLRQGGSLLGQSIVEGFIGDGLGRHSPGYMFWALVDEQTDINKALLQSRGIVNKNASLLGLELTNAFSSNLGIDRVFDSGIEFLRRDADVIKDIIADFDKEDFRTDDEQDLEYDLLPMQIDIQDGMYAVPKIMQDFVQPYGFDVSNYQRFGTNFGTALDSITQFESILWFTQSLYEFDSEKMFDSGLFDEEELYDYLELLHEAFNDDTKWSFFKQKTDHNISPSAFDNMNKFIEDYYFGFLATMSQEMTKTIINAPGLSDNVRLYRGGRLPVSSEGLGEYLGTTSTSYAKRVADIYTAMNSAVNYSANVYAPEGTLGVYMNRHQFGDRRTHIGSSIGGVFDNQIEYALGSGQPFIELPNEATGQLSGGLLRNEGDILLLDIQQIGEIQETVVDEVVSMLNAERTNSNILNLNGSQAVQNLLSEKNIISTNKSHQREQLYYDVYDYHEGPRGLIYDAAQYLRRIKKRRSVSPAELSALIASVNGEDAANEAMEWLNNTWITDVTNKNGKIQVKSLAEIIEKTDRFYKDFVKKQTYSEMSPEQIFRIAKNFPDIKDKLLPLLQPFTDIDKTPNLKDFQNRTDFNEKFIKVPYEYGWLLGQKEAQDLYSTNSDMIRDEDKHMPKPTAEGAKRLVDKFGTNVFFMPPQLYKNAEMRPTVENSFDRMMMGLAYGYLSNMSGAGGSHNPYSGIEVGDEGTELFGAANTLNTIIHEFTHMGLNQFLRYYLDESDPLYLPNNFESPGLYDKTGYRDNYPYIMSEFETNWVTTQVLGKFGLAEKADELLRDEDKSIGRVSAFYDATIQADPNNAKYFQWELYDEWIKVISENIDMFIDIGEEFDRKYSYLSPTEISQKWDEVRQMVNANQAPAEMPTSIFNSGYIEYREEQRKQEEARKATQNIAHGYKEWYKEQQKELNKLYKLRTENERARYGRLRIEKENRKKEEEGARNAAANREKLRKRRERQKKQYEEERKRKEESKWDKKRRAISEALDGGYYYFGGEKKEREQNDAQKFIQKWAFKGIGFAERVEKRGHDTISGLAQQYPTQQAHQYIESIEGVKNIVEGALGPMRSFRDGLVSAAEVFPSLTIAVTAMDTVIQIGEGIVWALDMAELILSGTRTFNQLQTWGLVTAEQAEALSKATATIATWGLNAAVAAFEILISGPVLIAIAAIAAAIATLWVWENKHAEALKNAQKELEESTAKNNIALSQYKDLKKARESETDAIKKQKAARKEAIALYELEAARINKRKAVHEEAKLRNDSVWGEYGYRAKLQKMGWLESIVAGGVPFLGTIMKATAGDFESQYENYDGTTANIRQIKEESLGNLFATQSQRQVASFYDNNSMFFAEVEAYKEPLQELYDKESKLIEQYGSIDLARGTKEFEEAVQEFADATGINGETAGMMLDWLETENRVDQATTAMQATANMIVAKADANAMKAMYPDLNTGGEGFSGVENTMIMAQAESIYKDAYDQMWWDWFGNTLWGYFNMLLAILDPLGLFGNHYEAMQKHFNVAEAYQEGMHELVDVGIDGLYQQGEEAAENAERRDYGTGTLSSYHDTPFGGAVSSAATAYAEEEQAKMFNETGQVMSENDYLAIQEQYQQDTFGITEEQLKQKKMKENEEAYQKAQAEKTKKANTTLEQLQNNGDQAHKDALDIIDAIKNPGGISGLGAGIFSLAQSDSPLIKSLRKRGLKDIFKYMEGEEGTLTGRAINFAKGHFENARAAYADEGFRGVYNYGKNAISQTRLASGLSKEASVVKGVYQTGGWNGLKGYAQGTLYEGIDAAKGLSNKGIDAIKNTKIFGKISDRIGLAREANALAADGVAVSRNGIDKAVGVFDGAKAAYADDGLKGLANFGREAGKSGIKGLAQAGKAASGELGGARGIISSVSTEVGGVKGLASSTARGMKDIFNPKALAGGVDDIAKGLGGSGTLARGIGKVGGRALAFLGPALAFAGKASELNPFEGKHYNEDGTEKKALQATGEVVGTTAGALGGVAGGLAGAEAGAALGATIGSVIPGVGTVIGGALGAVAGGIAGGWLGDTIFQPIGDAIGGTIGWLGDNLLGGIQNVAGTVWDGLTGAAGGVWEAVSGAAGGVWDFITNGGVIGMGVNAAAGIWDWLSGNNDPYKNIENTHGKQPPKRENQSGNTIIIKNININTEDDPEKIKSALMNLIIEMQEQITPRTVARTVGEPPSISTSDTQDENNNEQAEGTDPESGTPNGNQNTNPTN